MLRRKLCKYCPRSAVCLAAGGEPNYVNVKVLYDEQTKVMHTQAVQCYSYWPNRPRWPWSDGKTSFTIPEDVRA